MVEQSKIWQQLLLKIFLWHLNGLKALTQPLLPKRHDFRKMQSELTIAQYNGKLIWPWSGTNYQSLHGVMYESQLNGKWMARECATCLHIAKRKLINSLTSIVSSPSLLSSITFGSLSWAFFNSVVDSSLEKQTKQAWIRPSSPFSWKYARILCHAQNYMLVYFELF